MTLTVIEQVASEPELPYYYTQECSVEGTCVSTKTFVKITDTYEARIKFLYDERRVVIDINWSLNYWKKNYNHVLNFVDLETRTKYDIKKSSQKEFENAKEQIKIITQQF